MALITVGWACYFIWLEENYRVELIFLFNFCFVVYLFVDFSNRHYVCWVCLFLLITRCMYMYTRSPLLSVELNSIWLWWCGFLFSTQQQRLQCELIFSAAVEILWILVRLLVGKSFVVMSKYTVYFARIVVLEEGWPVACVLMCNFLNEKNVVSSKEAPAWKGWRTKGKKV